MDGITQTGMEKSRALMTSPLSRDPGALLSPALLNSPHKSLTTQSIVDERQKLIEAGKQFEAYFVSYLLKVMRETVPEGAIANKQGAYFHSFYDEEIGRRAAESGGLGITRMVQEHAEQYFSSPPRDPSSFAP
ncbi:MAG: rod-binding protein [Nitrospira sp.]|nr:rod-binding protein [Nitrospira sp.]MDH4302519.1 rod-binding protein [Nitrospira sp.]MDH5192363.1 rod-binding protein [Nitrospira sp.]